MLALALPDHGLVFDILVASFAVEPSSEIGSGLKCGVSFWAEWMTSYKMVHLFTSSADWAMKKPIVLAGT